jgi:Arc/MetJ-type ribon-helix-helix transcriptional regulator
LRRTITISVSDEMYSLIREGIRSCCYSTVSEYIRFLVRRDTRPETINRERPVYPPPRTANQCLEEARRSEGGLRVDS